LLLLASAFFFRELFERNLIGPVGRVSIGRFSDRRFGRRLGAAEGRIHGFVYSGLDLQTKVFLKPSCPNDSVRGR